MNARSQVFELALELRQVEEAVLSLFHTVLFHRTVGKYSYQNDLSYVQGVVGFEDVDCDFIDFTYVRPHSPALDAAVRQEVAAFSSDLKRVSSTLLNQGPSATSGQVASSPSGAGAVTPYQYAGRCGRVSLEFYQQRKNRWPFAAESIPWEVWTVCTDIVHFPNEHERANWREKLGELISDKVLYIAEVMNRHEYVPKTPAETELELIFDTRFPDVQPYLFKISYTTDGPNSPSMGTNLRRLLKDTLAI